MPDNPQNITLDVNSYVVKIYGFNQEEWLEGPFQTINEAEEHARKMADIYGASFLLPVRNPQCLNQL